MAPRRRKTKRRRSRAFSILNALEAYTYANIMTSGVFGTSPWGFLSGAGDLTSTTVTDLGLHSTSQVWTGGGEISLADLMQEPGQALSTTAANFRSNMFGMAVQAATVGIGFRIGKALLRRPIASVNRNIMKPLVGASFKV